MTGIISYGIHDCKHIKIVPVISSFDCSGRMIPLYVRIHGEALKIHTAYEFESTYNLLRFRCEVLDHGRIKPLKLTYHVSYHKWSMPSN